MTTTATTRHAASLSDTLIAGTVAAVVFAIAGLAVDSGLRGVHLAHQPAAAPVAATAVAAVPTATVLR